MKKIIHICFLLLLFTSAKVRVHGQATIPAADLPKTNSLAATNYIMAVIGGGGNSLWLINLSNLVENIIIQPNFLEAAGVTNIMVEAGTNIVVDSSIDGGITTYTISSASGTTNGLATTNYVQNLSTNSVWVRAGANITIQTNVTADRITFTITGSAGSSGSATNAITTLNGLTSIAQNFVVGSGGADITIVSSSSNHLFSFPTATATVRGVLSATDWSTFNSKQPTSSVLTALSGNLIPYTNIVIMGTNIIMTTNAGVVTISTLGYAPIFGIDQNNFTTNSGILAANTNFSITGTYFGTSMSLSNENRGFLELYDDSGTKRWSISSTNLMSTNVELRLPGFARTGIWYGTLLNNTNFDLEFLGNDTDGKVLTLTSGKPTWETPAASGGGGETNAFYYVKVATNALANKIVQSKLTNGSIQLPLTLALMSIMPPELDPGSNSIPRLRFDGGTNIETCYWFFTLPDDYGSGGTVTYPFTTLSSAANQTSVWFQFTMINHPGSSTVVDVNNYLATVSNSVLHPATAGFPSSFSMSCNLDTGPAAAGDFIKVTLVRDPNDTNDVAASDVALRPNPIFQYNRR